MKKSTAKARRQKKPQSPVIAGRVSEAQYQRIKEATKQSGRSMSEELAWRFDHSLAMEKAHGDAKKIIADAWSVTKDTLRGAMRQQGFTPIYSSAGTYWAEPGMLAMPLEGQLAPEVRAAITDAVRQALTEIKGKSE
jgi:hypothetical protein